MAARPSRPAPHPACPRADRDAGPLFPPTLRLKTRRRHFGGVKLGTGGLARAYGGAARDCLRSAPKAFVRRRATLAAECPFALLGAVYGAVQRLGGAPEGGEEYTEGGGVVVRFCIDADAAGAAAEAVADATSGRVRLRPVTEGA
jgi:putative IMPACT (imprinted ancient) family translation regulator